MGLFDRRHARPSPDAERIEQFWHWWTTTGAEAVAQALDEGRVLEMVDEITARVKAINLVLAWELGPGDTSRHQLIVTPGGDPTARAVARRWVLRAPETDATWAYRDSRQPAADPESAELEVAGERLDVASAVAAVAIRGAAVDLGVHHPAYARLGEQERQVATFLLLDTVLGEATVETWVGAVTATAFMPLDPVPLAMVRGVVRDLAASFRDADGAPRWVLLTGESPEGHAILASAEVPLRPVVAPHLDTYVGIFLPFGDQTDVGLPGPAALIALRDLEDQVVSALGVDGKPVAHQTSAGVRVLHVYVDGTTSAVDTVRRLAKLWPGGGADVHEQPDPEWASVAHLRA